MRRLVVLLFVAGCGSPPDDVLRSALTGDFRSLDPGLAYSMSDVDYVKLVHLTLLDYDDEGRTLVPRLAQEMPEVSADGRVYTFKLRPGVRYPSGRELVASDFVFAIDRVLDPATKSPWSGYFRAILGAVEVMEKKADHAQGLSAPDDRTLRIELVEPAPAFSFALALPASAPLTPGAIDDRPAGVGPYRVAAWRRSVRARFERNPHYALEPVPDFNAVEVKLGLDRLTQVMMLERGEIDVLHGISAGDFVRLRRDPKWGPRMTSLTENATFFLALNCEVEPFTDVRVRRAFSHAIDRERIVRSINGRGVPARGVIPPLMAGHDPHLEGYAYDPAAARRLLAEAGYGGGLRLKMWYTTAINDHEKVAEVVQQDLRSVGVELTLVRAAYPVFLTATGTRGEVAMSLAGWFQDFPDASTFLDVLFSGKRISDVESTNTCFFDDPEVNRLIDEASREAMGQARQERYRAAERAMLDQAPAVFLYHNVSYGLSSPRVTGYVLHPVWVERFDRVRRARP
jgi:ABC-type transport system substrate-binding protein